MNAVKLIAVLLIVGGLFGLASGSFSFTKETHNATLGPIELSIDEKQTVDIPLWASVIAIVAGAGLLVVGFKKA